MPAMHSSATSPRSGHRLRNFAIAVVAAILLLMAGIYTSFRIVLATPFASAKLSEILSRAVGVPVTVTGIQATGGAVTVSGLLIGNPSGYSEKPFVALRSVTVKPQWESLFRTPRHIPKIEVDGLAVSLEKNALGWNYLRLFPKTKEQKPATETVIDRLVISDSALKINGLGVGISNVTAANISTTGSRTAEFDGTFTDPLGNNVRIKGQGKGGTAPSFTGELQAPAISFERLPDVLKKKFSPFITGATGSLALNASFSDNLLKVSPRVTLKSALHKTPLVGAITVDAVYHLDNDSLSVTRANIETNQIKAALTGEVTSVKKDANYMFRIDLSPVDLSMANVFIKKGVTVAGSATFSTIELAGTKAAGISSVTGGGNFSNVILSDRKGNRIVELTGETTLHGSGAGIALSGHLGRIKQFRAQLIEDLAGDFSASFSGKFALTVAQADLTGRVAGGSASLHAEVGERGARPAGRLAVKGVSVAKLAEVLAPARGIIAGTLNASTEFAGPTTSAIDGKGDITLSDTAMSTGEKKHTVGKMTVRTFYKLRQRALAAETSVEASGTSGGKIWNTTFQSRFGDQRLALRQAKIAFADLAATIPEAAVSFSEEGKITVFDVALRDVAVMSPTFAAAGISGTGHILGTKLPTMTADALVNVTKASFKGADIGAQTVKIAVKDGTGTAILSGLGGKLNGAATSDLSGEDFAVKFTGNLVDYPVAQLSPLLPKTSRTLPAAGVLSATFSGSHGKKSGLAVTAGIKGSGISARNADDRILFEGLRLNGDVEVARETLSLKKGVIAIGESASASVDGEMKNYASPVRKGAFTFVVSPAPVNALLDAFANALPPTLQEASATGHLGLKGNAVISGTKTLINGEISVGKIEVDLPSQKVHLTDLDGSIPFSIQPGGEKGRKPQQGPSFSRDGYQSVLAYLQEKSRSSSGGLTINKIVFGASEIGPVALTLQAQDGVTIIDHARADIYGGRILGTGYLMYGQRPDFSVNLAVNDVSLRTLCDSYPNIKNYISGRVDGVLSVAGNSFKSNDMKGFLHFWTRENKKEKMLVSKEFLQKLAGKKLKGIFFRNDRSYDNGEISAFLGNGYLSFSTLDLSNTNIFGVRDLSVSVAPVQNKIALTHLLDSIKEAAARGKAVKTGDGDAAPPVTDFKWDE